MDVEKIKPKVAELAEKYGFSLVLLFGSQATGKTHPQSDTDIAFKSEKPMDLMDVAKLQMVFSQKLRIKDLELVDLKDASPLLLKQIADNSILLYEKDRSAFNKFKIYAFKIFMEAKKLLQLRELSLNKFLQRT